jgi:hypothetical protein
MWLVRALGVALFVAVQACAEASPPPASSAAPPATNVDRAKPANAPSKMVCKRVPIVGSNVGTERVCVPRNDVGKASESGQDDLRAQDGRSDGNRS